MDDFEERAVFTSLGGNGLALGSHIFYS